MEDNNYFGKKMKILREQSGISQTQLAQYLGVDQSLVSRVEKNERQPNLEMVEKAAALFGLSSENLESNQECATTLQFAFRANEVTSEDFEAVAAVNRIALNLREMKRILGGAGF